MHMAMDTSLQGKGMGAPTPPPAQHPNVSLTGIGMAPPTAAPATGAPLPNFVADMEEYTGTRPPITQPGDSYGLSQGKRL